MPKGRDVDPPSKAARFDRRTTPRPVRTGRSTAMTCWWPRSAIGLGRHRRAAETLSAATGVSSNYRFDPSSRAPGDFIRGMRRVQPGHTRPGRGKCGRRPEDRLSGGDHWRREGVLSEHRHPPGGARSGFSGSRSPDSLDKVIADYGITLHTESEVRAVDSDARKLAVTGVGPSGANMMLPYDMLHVVPRSPRRTGSSPVRCPPVTRTGSSRSTSTPCNTCATPTCSASATSPRHRTRKPVPRCARGPGRRREHRRPFKGRPRTGSYDGYLSCPYRHVPHRDAARRVRLRPEDDAVVPLLDPAKPHRPYWPEEAGPPFCTGT